MFYKSELNYLMKVLKKMHLQALLLDVDQKNNYQIDFGFRKFLGLEDDYRLAYENRGSWNKENTIYRMRDEFMCSYVFLLLPEAAQTQGLLIGPYTTVSMSREMMMETAERFKVPAKQFQRLASYYEGIPVLENEMPLFAMLTAFGEVLWGDSAAFEVVDINAEVISPIKILPNDSEDRDSEDTMLHMKLMEARYGFENELMDMVAHGQTHRAEVMMKGFSGSSFEERLSDPLRNLKNYLIISNTLLRKAAERGGVHPIYLDRISSDFAKKIEAVPNTQTGRELMGTMVRDYCRLVRKHATKQYSPIIQKAVACIESGLTDDLSLRTLATALNVNASYLSALFSKETGQTVTEYVNEKRMKAGAQLLHATRLQVQTIAQYCGVSDVNYFSKMFKKYYGMTPKQFRETGSNSLKRK